MHNESGDTLFVGSTRLPIPLSIRLLVVLLMTMVIFTQNDLNVKISVFFMILMAIEKVTLARWTILILFLINTFLLYLFCLFFLEEFNEVQLSKTCASITTISWFGSTVSWPEFRRRYLNHFLLKDLATLVERGIYQGQILLEQVQKRFDTLRLRAKHQPYLPKNIALALGGGIASAFERSDRIEDSLYLRSKVKPISSQPSLSLKSCHVVQQNRKILKGISLDISPGQWLFLGGSSGSGKTTLLNMISGLVKPKMGHISPPHLDLGFIFQNPDNQFFATTPREDIIWGLEKSGIAPKEAKKVASEWLTKMKINHIADRSLALLSFGEKKRVAFAGALALRPKILLCDEPTAGLDFLAAKQLIELLECISRQRPFSVIWTSHDLELLPKKISKALLIKDGETVFYGTLADALINKNLVLAGLR